MPLHRPCPSRAGTWSPASNLSSSQQSMLTYASTLAEDVDEPVQYWSDVQPASSHDFGALFPSTRRLDLRHDESTSDGNMNMRVDTNITPGNRVVTLYHLRMHNLRTRTFSLRRYSRDSGREVCNTHRKHLPSRPTLSQSLSSVLAGFKESDNRRDSGYSTLSDKARLSSPCISLEFSNYFRLDLRRNGLTQKRYDFEYWGVSYCWKRIVKKNFGLHVVSYHLLRGKEESAIAHIVPQPLSCDEARAERDAGGWISPSSFWLSEHVAADVADVLMATGIVAFVDGSIRRHFRGREKSMQGLRSLWNDT